MTSQFVDAVSGHPMVFAPTHEVYTHAIRNIVDRHHPVHPASHPLLSGVAGKAIRECRGQLVDYYDHHVRYRHEDIELRLPHNDDERIRYIGFTLAGYLDKSICFRMGSPQAISLNNRQRERLRNSGELGIINGVAVREFLVSRVMDQTITDDYEGLEQEFYQAENPTKQRVAGHEVFAAKVRMSTAGFKEDYIEARREGLLDPRAPQNPSKLIHDFIGDFLFRDRIVGLLHQNAHSSGEGIISGMRPPTDGLPVVRFDQQR